MALCAALTALACGAKQGTASLEFYATSKTAVRGAPIMLHVSAIDAAGKAGTGPVIFQSSIGSLAAGLSADLDDYGNASAPFVCDANDAACTAADSVQITATWKAKVELDTSITVRLGATSGGGGGGGGGDGTGTQTGIRIVTAPCSQAAKDTRKYGIDLSCCNSDSFPKCGEVGVVADGTMFTLRFAPTDDGGVRDIAMKTSVPSGFTLAECNNTTKQYGFVATDAGDSNSLRNGYSDGTIDDTGVWLAFQSGGGLPYSTPHPTLCERWADAKTKAIYATFTAFDTNYHQENWQRLSGQPPTFIVIMRK